MIGLKVDPRVPTVDDAHIGDGEAQLLPRRILHLHDFADAHAAQQVEVRIAVSFDDAIADLSRHHARRIVRRAKGEVPTADALEHY